jgi:hypothetical protein
MPEANTKPTHLTIMFTTEEVATLLGAISDALNDLCAKTPSTDSDKQMTTNLTELYNKIWTGIWS